jgi:hypothetical protein
VASDLPGVIASANAFKIKPGEVLSPSGVL